MCVQCLDYHNHNHICSHADDYDDDNSAVLYQKLATLMIIGASAHPQDDSNQLHCSNEKGSLAPVFWQD